MQPIIAIEKLSKTYQSGLKALTGIDLNIRKGEIFALLGANGAGKTTLISIVCGIVTPTSGRVSVDGHDIQRDYRRARSLIGLVPQELIMTLSGGMKRRVMIAKALSHEPSVLFLDEPTAGVDVELRRDMWAMVRAMRETGVTVILTTHYIEEAEEMADRVGVISKGELILVQEKAELMRKLGKKELLLHLDKPLADIPPGLETFALRLENDGSDLVYVYDRQSEHTGLATLLRALADTGVRFRDLETRQSSLEDIFISLLKDAA